MATTAEIEHSVQMLREATGIADLHTTSTRKLTDAGWLTVWELVSEQVPQAIPLGSTKAVVLSSVRMAVVGATLAAGRDSR